VTSKYEFIDAERATVDEDGLPRYLVKQMCAWLGVSRSGYHDWRSRAQSATAARRMQLRAMIEHVFVEHDGRYGFRRIHAVLIRRGFACSPDLVRSLMREAGLVACRPRRARMRTTRADEQAAPIPDLVGRDFTADAPGKVFVGDITYVPTWEGWLYVALVIDCYSRCIAGWAMDDNYKTPLIVEAVTMAARNIPPISEAVFHSDRGSNGGFNWSSQHLDHGGVWWRRATGAGRRAMRLRGCGGSGVLIGRCGRRCAHRGDLTPRGWCSGSSGDRSPRALRRRRHRSLSGCRSRWGCVGFVTLAACRRSALPSPQGAI